MKRRIATVLVAITFVIGCGLGLSLLRNYIVAKAVEDMKFERGSEALKWLTPLANLGDRSAQVMVGYIHAFGTGGVPTSDTDAIYWFRRTGFLNAVVPSDGLDPAAPHELAVAKAFANGDQGVKKDLQQSRKWLKLAAEGGNKEAATLLIQLPE